MSRRSVVEDVEAAEASRARAIVEADLETLDRLTDPDLVHIDITGRVRTKAQFLDQLQDGGHRYRTYELLENTVHVSGDVAAVSGVFRNTLLTNGEEIRKIARHLRVYLRRNEAWKTIVHQATSLDQA